jgi:hypothetical protein
VEEAKKSHARLAARATAAIAAAGVSLALVASAGAEQVTGGKSVLKPDVDTFEALADMSIGVEATGAAKWGKNGAKFPVSGGDVDVSKATPTGMVNHRGGLAFFTEGGPGVKFSKLVVKLGKKKTKVFAKSGGAEVRFMDVKGTGETAGGGEDGIVFLKNAKASLSKEGAEVLSETFDFPFRKGIKLGKLNVKAQFSD